MYSIKYCLCYIFKIREPIKYIIAIDYSETGAKNVEALYVLL